MKPSLVVRYGPLWPLQPSLAPKCPFGEKYNRTCLGETCVQGMHAACPPWLTATTRHSYPVNPGDTGVSPGDTGAADVPNPHRLNPFDSGLIDVAESHPASASDIRTTHTPAGAKYRARCLRE
jgi:hypothetical protein